MKRKVLGVAGVGALILVLIISVVRYIEVRTHQTDPNRQIANVIYKVENALKEVDEGFPLTYSSTAASFSSGLYRLLLDIIYPHKKQFFFSTVS